MTKTNAALPSAQLVEDTPETKGNYSAVQFNAMKHGILSRHTVLPHEDQDEFASLLAALTHEHKPAGMTEAHLVEELAGIIWRKRRVLQAEGSNINRGLKYAAQNTKEVISAAVPFDPDLSGKDSNLQEMLMLTPEEVTQRQQDATHDLEATRKAATILERGSKNAYVNALKALQEDSRDWWHEYAEEEEYEETTDGLSEFIKDHLEPLCLSVEKEAQHHAAIKAQTLGEGLKVHMLEKLSRYETHLDRKFQRILAMLVKLKELRVE